MNRKVLSNMLPDRSKSGVIPQIKPEFTLKQVVAFHQQSEVQTTRNYLQNVIINLGNYDTLQKIQSLIFETISVP